MDGIFKPWFPPIDGVDTWANWKAVLKAMDALPMSAAEIEFFKSIAGDREPPTRRVSEFVAACARRTGKDAVASVIAAHSAALFDQQDRLRPGERAQVLCLASDRDQAKIVLNYIRSYFTDIPAMAKMVLRTTATGFELRNNVVVTVATSSFRAVRGKPVLLAVMDEAAFMRSEFSASPDTELYSALKPALLTIPGSRIVIISSPYRKSGLLWDRYKKCFGENDDNTLVIQASLRQLNPTITQAQIDAEVEADPAAAVSELFGRFRDDIGALMPLEMIESSVDQGVMVRPPQKWFTYHCGVDPSGGVSDSFTAAISHAEEDGNIVLDAVLEIRPPFDPAYAVEQVAGLLKSYGLSECTGDRYSAQFVVSAFAKHDVTYRHSERDRSKIYQDVLACFTSGRARLIDTPKNRLVVQFAGLQRTTSSMGRDKIDHQKGQKDDLANAASLAMVLASVGQQQPVLLFSGIPQRRFNPGTGGYYGEGGIF
ncbi:terminase large subunit domain-containing protein [Bradyrhizobium genosp. P]|uniref:terminase large subunit domain-containing protein n=1 Tax=Bradyrhizobium genosp. P TaxID=83641 RepID=UPI003CE8BE15